MIFELRVHSIGLLKFALDWMTHSKVIFILRKKGKWPDHTGTALRNPILRSPVDRERSAVDG